MFARDVEMFIEHCENKGLATKTIGSYEQTLRLLMLWLDEQGITQTEKITHVVIQDYVKQIKERGKYTVTSNPNSGNYQERRIDIGKKVSDVTINNYLRNMSVFFNWCVEEGLILRSPVKRRDYIKVERRPLEFVSDEDFRKLLRNMNTASFSEYRDYIIIQLLLDTGILNEKKTHICKLSGEYRYLQVKYTLLQNGIVVRRIHPKAITRERRKLKAYKRLLDKGIVTIEEIDGYFRSWLSGNYKYMSRDQIYKMNSLYVKLFGRSVTWKKGHGRLRWLMAHPSAA